MQVASFTVQLAIPFPTPPLGLAPVLLCNGCCSGTKIVLDKGIQNSRTLTARKLALKERLEPFQTYKIAFILSFWSPAAKNPIVSLPEHSGHHSSLTGRDVAGVLSFSFLQLVHLCPKTLNLVLARSQIFLLLINDLLLPCHLALLLPDARSQIFLLLINDLLLPCHLALLLLDFVLLVVYQHEELAAWSHSFVDTG